MPTSFGNLDLPVDEVRGYIESMLGELGLDCYVDGKETRIMLSDLPNTYNSIDENSKQAVVLKNVDIERGSTVLFDNGDRAIVYTIPNDDMVSYSLRLLMCNAEVDIVEHDDVYNDDGTIRDTITHISNTLVGYVERVSAKEKQLDMGLLYETKLKFITSDDELVSHGEIFMYRDKEYRVIDIDDITSGILVIQLESV